MRILKTLLKRAVPDRISGMTRRMRTKIYRSRQRMFDRKFGVDTSELIEVSDMNIDEERRESGNPYEATPRSVFLRIMRSIQVDYRQFYFVDIGSGKGAVLLYASEFPFRRIIGVEYSTTFNQVAERNIQRYVKDSAKCKDINTVCTDALEYSLPTEPLILYLANPFKSKMMTKMVAIIEQSVKEHPREVIIASFNPVVEEVLDSAPWLERLRTGWNYAIYRSKVQFPKVGERMHIAR